MANNYLKVKKDTYCILGDGELQEGQIWEADNVYWCKKNFRYMHYGQSK